VRLQARFIEWTQTYKFLNKFFEEVMTTTFFRMLQPTL